MTDYHDQKIVGDLEREEIFSIIELYKNHNAMLGKTTNKDVSARLCTAIYNKCNDINLITAFFKKYIKNTREIKFRGLEFNDFEAYYSKCIKDIDFKNKMLGIENKGYAGCSFCNDEKFLKIQYLADSSISQTICVCEFKKEENNLNHKYAQIKEKRDLHAYFIEQCFYWVNSGFKKPELSLSQINDIKISKEKKEVVCSQLIADFIGGV